MKKVLLAILLLVVIALLAMKPLLNISPLAVGDAVRVATGLGAKLTCSAHYVSGFDAAKAVSDMTAYSPAYEMLEVSYTPENRQAVASLPLIGSKAASYRPGLGCTLDLPGAELLDAVTVPVVAGSDLPWPAGADTQGQGRPAAQAALAALLARDTQEGEDTRALVMVRGGEIIAEAYAPGITPDTPLLGWSMGKSVTAILLGLLERDGELNVDETALFPQWQDSPRTAISVENLLQMSSGLAWVEEYTPGTDVSRMLASEASASALALDKALQDQPGTRFYYSSGTTNLLARLLSNRLGGTQATVEFVFQRLFEPLGMHRSVFELDASGVLVGSSYPYFSARDWARLGQLLLNEGELNGYRLLSADWVHRAISPNASDNDPRYGYQIWLNGGGDSLRWPDLPEDSYAMQGNRGQIVLVIPSLDTVIVRLGWSPAEYPRSSRFAELLQAVD